MENMDKKSRAMAYIANKLSDEHKDLTAKLKTYGSEEAIATHYTRQKSALSPPQELALSQNLIADPLGLRFRENERHFRQDSPELIVREYVAAAYDARHPTCNWDGLWCPVVKEWWEGLSVYPTRIFPVMPGPSVMHTLFGESESGDELMSKQNLLLLCTPIKRDFEKLLIALVPDCDLYDADAVMAWYRSSPQEYKVEVIDPEHLEMRRASNARGATWNNLHGEKVARITGSPSRVTERFSRMYWGLAEPFFTSAMLSGAAEQAGVGHEDLLISGAGFVGQPKEYTLASVVNRVILRSCGEGTYDTDDEEAEEAEDAEEEAWYRPSF
ncbi:hypothetical protein LTR56_011570 [Elasticomyces elasticus]|nr:hypothetical protein LTR56_011570 [Elasticomyces elasticus]KAK3657002.1 hypothetical protein LTR22_009503 [Elasticomyces elasticus]KAK4916225.1 hypothetical protein LTR49_015730 [Elasticomyces elasticus]KAK5764238.1 hypothetical protein LTS12_005689 [Elasticomyces elasticus]